MKFHYLYCELSINFGPVGNGFDSFNVCDNTKVHDIIKGKKEEKVASKGK